MITGPILQSLVFMKISHFLQVIQYLMPHVQQVSASPMDLVNVSSVAVPSSKAKVQAQLEAAKKKYTPAGETPAQTTKRSQEYGKQVLSKHKACGPGKAYSTKLNRCVDLKSTRTAGTSIRWSG